MEEENMKKIIALLLSILMVCSLAACASKQDTAAATETASTETAASSSEEKTLTMATNVAFPPYEFYEIDNRDTADPAEFLSRIEMRVDSPAVGHSISGNKA